MSKPNKQSDLGKKNECCKRFADKLGKTPNTSLVRNVRRLRSLTENQCHLTAQTVIRMQRLLLVVLFLVFGV